jgi:hypothetical protein
VPARSFAFLFFTAGAALVGVAGCGGNPVAEVAGTVTYRGQPLPLATIVFVDETGRQSAAGAVENGKFLVSGVPAGGEVKILLTVDGYVQEIDRFTARERGRRGLPESPEGGVMPLEQVLAHGVLPDCGQTDPQQLQRILDLRRRLVRIPSQYRSESETPLCYAIKPRAEQISITLEEGAPDETDEGTEPEEGADR